MDRSDLSLSTAFLRSPHPDDVALVDSENAAVGSYVDGSRSVSGNLNPSATNQSLGMTSSRMGGGATSLTSMLGPAVAVTLLLSDYGKYGLTERVSYHFHLTEALADSSVEISDPNQSNFQITEDLQKRKGNTATTTTVSTKSAPSSSAATTKQAQEEPSNKRGLQNVCGVAKLLECIPTRMHLTRVERRALRFAIQRANVSAKRAAADQRILCHEPHSEKWPLKLTPTSRVFFAYQKTRIVFMVDASPTLTATFGFSRAQSTSSACCPLDLIPTMARTYLTSLVEPIALQFKDVWQPEISVTVMAVYPSGPYRDKKTSTSFLIRGFDLVDDASAEELVKLMENWLYSVVEEEISIRLSDHRPSFLQNDWTLPTVQQQQSCLREWLEAGDAALSTLSSEARPLLVVATDCRSVTGDAVVSLMTSENRVDQPLSILHVGSSTVAEGRQLAALSPNPTIAQVMLSDLGGPAFPLHISNDMEALYGISKATGGCFWDMALLQQASHTHAGRVDDTTSSFTLDHFFTRRHTAHPNAVQWYTLFSLSPLTPPPNSACGKLSPPEYILASRNLRSQAANGSVTPQFPSDQRYGMQSTPSSTNWSNPNNSSSVPYSFGAPPERHPSQASGILSMLTASSGSANPVDLFTAHRYQNRTTFSIYVINPIRIQNLLQMRVREGYRASRYGARTNDPDRVDILFVLPLDLDTLLQYELSYKALPNHNHMVGSAQIKIYLSGNASFIQKVKQDFVQSPDPSTKEKTLAQQISDRICRVLRWIRKEDMLASYIAPIHWTKQLLMKNAPFVKRLGTLTKQQRLRHFRTDQFDCVCVGNMPYNVQTSSFLNDAFRDDSNKGEVGLLQALKDWSTQVIHSGQGTKSQGLFLRKMKSAAGDLASYCMVEIIQPMPSSRIFTVLVQTFGGSGASDRLALLSSLRDMVDGLKDVRVMDKQVSPYLVAVRMDFKDQLQEGDRARAWLENQTNHASWDLMDVMDGERLPDELLPLLMRRRVEIDDFYLVESADDHALLAQIARGTDRGDPGELIQYQIVKLADRVIVDLHMELPLRSLPQKDSRFSKLSNTLESTDKECALALRARTNLLASLSSEGNALNEYSSLLTILPYTSRNYIRLRYFQEWSPSANEVLKLLLQQFLLSMNNSPEIARVYLGPGEEVTEFGKGDWFVCKHDIETMTLLHMGEIDRTEVSNIDGRSRCLREINLCTLSTADLYFSRHGQKEVSYVEEYIYVEEFSDLLATVHADLYALAGYLALRQDGYQQKDVHLDDFIEVSERLDWVEAASVIVERGSQKLVDLISTILHQVKGESYYFYFAFQQTAEHFGDTESEETDESSVDLPDDSEHSESTAAEDDEDGSYDALPVVDEHHKEEDGGEEFFGGDYLSLAGEKTSSPTAPLFFLFLVDGRPASALDLSKISHSSSVSAIVSVFRPKRGIINRLPKSHRIAAAKLSKLLNAYIAGQTLERLRIQGAGIAQADLRLAKICLRKAQDVVVSKVGLQFYSADSGAIVRTGFGGSNTEAESLFEDELRANPVLSLKSEGSGNFVVVGAINDAFQESLAFWCFVAIRRSQGCVTVKVHHSSGFSEAQRIASEVSDAVSQTCHKVNQILLLRHMHSSRMASDLIVPVEEETTQTPLDEPQEGEEKPSAGFFSCPIQFCSNFELFHRGNPVQVARTLESTVLHMFSLLNRRHIFVYKDESGSIFYMRLEPIDARDQDGEGKIQLQVRGVEKPGISVTEQLTKLLAKRLMHIGVDMLSVVLTKNPHYSWKDADISFVQNFRDQWLPLADPESTSGEQYNERRYGFPSDVYDLGTLMLFFRQNLCGSTFFHPLIRSQPRNPVETDGKIEGSGAGARSKAMEMNFFFNNTPSKLNTSLQAQSTLTSKGEEYRRLAGSGLAIIEVSLVNMVGNPLRDIKIGRPLPPGWKAGKAPRSILLTSGQEGEQLGLSPLRLSVRIYDTALQADYLHQWVRLTLDQVLASWTIERHLEWQRGQASENSVQENASNSADSISPGLSTFVSLVKDSYMIPHPAVKVFDNSGVLRSSEVVLLASKWLHTILDPVRALLKAPQKALLERNLIAVRTSRSSSPAKIDWRRLGTLKQKDEPTDCPEYIFYFYLPPNNKITDREEEEKLSSSPKIFRFVTVEKERISELEEPELNALVRSFAFSFSVKRNRRTLCAYNWERSLFENVSRDLQDEAESFLRTLNTSNDRLQRRALGILSPSSGSIVGKSHNPAAIEEKTKIEESGSMIKEGGSSRRRPIRQPKLVGKSVEGAAAQALAASRARASFRGTYGVPAKPSVPRAGARPAAKRSSPRSSSGPRSQLSKGDSQIVQLHREVSSHISSASSKNRMLRRHVLHYSTVVSLSDYILLLESRRPTKQATDFLLGDSAVAWDIACKILPLPGSALETLASNIGKALASRSEDLTPISLSSTGSDNSSSASFFLLKQPRNVRYAKVGVVVKLELLRKVDSHFLRCQGLNVFLSRKSKNVPAIFQSISERDAAGSDKLASETIHRTRVDNLVFDFMVCAAGILTKGSARYPMEGIGMSLLNDLVSSYPLSDQLRMADAQFKVYRAPLILTSYRNELINLSDSIRLFGWLKAYQRKRGMAQLGELALLCLRDIVVKGSHSAIILTCNPEDRTTLGLVILCRTNGRDIGELMFRGQSNVAVPVATCIAIEGATIMYEELTVAATSLYRESLWGKVSKSNSSGQLGNKELLKLIGLCFLVPIASGGSKLGLLLEELNQDCRQCCDKMLEDRAFQPSFKISGEGQPCDQWMFYMPSEDLFLLARTQSESNSQLLFFILCQEKSALSEHSSSLLIQRFANYVLHYLWKDVLLI